MIPKNESKGCWSPSSQRCWFQGFSRHAPQNAHLERHIWWQLIQSKIFGYAISWPIVRVRLSWATQCTFQSYWTFIRFEGHECIIRTHSLFMFKWSIWMCCNKVITRLHWKKKNNSLFQHFGKSIFHGAKVARDLSGGRPGKMAVYETGADEATVAGWCWGNRVTRIIFWRFNGN